MLSSKRISTCTINASEQTCVVKTSSLRHLSTNISSISELMFAAVSKILALAPENKGVNILTKPTFSAGPYALMQLSRLTINCRQIWEYPRA